jgi:hypothetical protein
MAFSVMDVIDVVAVRDRLVAVTGQMLVIAGLGVLLRRHGYLHRVIGANLVPNGNRCQ